MSALWIYLHDNSGDIGSWTVTTTWLSLLPVTMGLVLGVPTGYLAARRRWLYQILVTATGALYTVPSLVMLVVLPGLLHTGILSRINVAVALTIYSYALLVRAVADALNAVPTSVLEAGTAMGQTAWQQLLQLELPLATPVIAAGVRVAAVSNVSLVSVASIVGVDQLGQLFTAGSNTGTLAPIVLGLIILMAMAFVIDAAILGLSRLATPWQRAAAR